jgi:hypothetical protein
VGGRIEADQTVQWRKCLLTRRGCAAAGQVRAALEFFGPVQHVVCPDPSKAFVFASFADAADAACACEALNQSVRASHSRQPPMLSSMGTAVATLSLYVGWRRSAAPPPALLGTETSVAT